MADEYLISELKHSELKQKVSCLELELDDLKSTMKANKELEERLKALIREDAANERKRFWGVTVAGVVLLALGSVTAVYKLPSAVRSGSYGEVRRDPERGRSERENN